MSRQRVLGGLLAAFSLGCSAPDPGAPAAEAGAPAADAPASPAPVGPKPAELRSAGDGPVAPLVARARAAAEVEGATLVVYVGASWCEPCVAFHDGLSRGEVADALPGLRFLEFDLDRDQARLADAGYTSRLIPLMVLPDDAGRAGPRRIEGGIKGPGAADDLVRRIRELTSKGP